MTNRYSIAVTVTVSIRGGCIYGHVCRQEKVRKRIEEPENESNTHHDTCSRTTAEVQLAVNVAQVISHRPDGAVERDDIAVLVLQLR